MTDINQAKDRLKNALNRLESVLDIKFAKSKEYVQKLKQAENENVRLKEKVKYLQESNEKLTDTLQTIRSGKNKEQKAKLAEIELDDNVIQSVNHANSISIKEFKSLIGEE